MTSTTTLRLLKRTEISYAVAGVIEGGLVDGDMYPDKASIELDHRSPATGKVSSAIVKLKIPKNGRYHRSAPILTDEFSKQKYLIEIQFHQDGVDGFLFRGELGEPTIIQDPTLGEIISIPCESIFRVIRETSISPVQLKADPQNRFIRLITDYDKARGQGTTITFRGNVDTTAIDLPSDSVLNRTWIPFGPTKVKKLFNEVIDVIEDAPQVGGKLVDWYYDEEVSTFATRVTAIFAEEFGLNSSGVVIDPTSFSPAGEGSEEKKQINTDNIAYKNHIIGKGDARSGTTPSNLQRFRSFHLNGTNRRIYKNSASYSKGQGVKLQFSGDFPDERYFIATVDTSNHPLLPPFDKDAIVNSQWLEDFTIDPTNTSTINRNQFFSPNPWFSDLNLARSNIVGKGNGGLGVQAGANKKSSYEGSFFDWNIERTLYDRKIANDAYERVSVKSVNMRRNSPPLQSELYDGYRIVLGTFGVNDFTIGPGFEGRNKTVDGLDAFTNANRGKVLEYNGNPNVLQGTGDDPKDTDANGWILSDAPLDSGSGSNRTQDTVTNLETMKILKWEIGAGGGARPDGDFVDSWDLLTDDNFSTPFHLVKETRLVTGATGIPNQAFEAVYDFKNFGLRVPFESSNGDDRNKTSRGVWLSWINPLPYLPTSPLNTGDICGKDREFPYFDSYNLNRTCFGDIGWNNGLSSEDLGGANGVHFKLRSGWFVGEGETPGDKALGYENMPHVYWSMDKWGHVFFQDFIQPANYVWETHDLDFGVRAKQNYFFSRFDELAEVAGYKLPFNFFIPEREFTGKAFDWRFVKYQGIFAKYMYSEDAGHYMGSINQYFKSITEFWEQAKHKGLSITAKIVNFFGGSVPDSDIPLNDDFIIDHATIAIDEFCYITEMYANSDETEVADPRTEVVPFESERDYLTLRARARATKARKQFFPQFWHIGGHSDVRMKVGQRFIVAGPEVPGGTKELVCAEVKFMDDQSGSTMEMLGVNKFVATAGS